MTSWIKIKDEQPQENQIVLCLSENVVGYATWKDCLFQAGEFVSFREPYFKENIEWLWMPLPKGKE